MEALSAADHAAWISATIATGREPRTRNQPPHVTPPGAENHGSSHDLSLTDIRPTVEVTSRPASRAEQIDSKENLEDRRLFPAGATDGPRADAPGSAILNELFYRFLGTGYEQARDARLLTQAAIDHKPDALDPLRDPSNSVTSA